jgi:hypothetical protein
VIVDEADWGNIYAWKKKYDTAIENLLKGHESEHAFDCVVVAIIRAKSSCARVAHDDFVRKKTNLVLKDV